MADPKPIALWAVPRSLSTAFERVFVERDDIEVLHEPFSAAYYYGPDRLSNRYADVKPRPQNSYENVLAQVFKPRRKRLFLKDMAYQAKGVMGPEFIANFANTFIIRDPKYVLSSLHKMWPNFTLEETGYEELYWAFRYASEAGEDPVVVDAMTFSENPVGIISAYCERVDIPFRPDALSWKPGEVEEWKSWEGWHEAAQQSTGIKRAERRDPVLPEELQEAYQDCLPYYYTLAAHTISPTTRPSGKDTRHKEGDRL
jgi:hypothetical protein